MMGGFGAGERSPSNIHNPQVCASGGSGFPITKSVGYNIFFLFLKTVIGVTKVLTI